MITKGSFLLFFVLVKANVLHSMNEQTVIKKWGGLEVTITIPQSYHEDHESYVESNKKIFEKAIIAACNFSRKQLKFTSLKTINPEISILEKDSRIDIGIEQNDYPINHTNPTHFSVSTFTHLAYHPEQKTTTCIKELIGISNKQKQSRTFYEIQH